MQLKKRVNKIVFYLAQFNVTFGTVPVLCVMQLFKNKYYVSDDDILH